MGRTMTSAERLQASLLVYVIRLVCRHLWTKSLLLYTQINFVDLHCKVKYESHPKLSVYELNILDILIPRT